MMLVEAVCVCVSQRMFDYLIRLLVPLVLGAFGLCAILRTGLSAQQWDVELNFVRMKQLCPETGMAPAGSELR